MIDQSQIMNTQNYALWPTPPPPPPPPENSVFFFTAPPNTGRNNWKGNKPDFRRRDSFTAGNNYLVSGCGGVGGYNSPNSNDLRFQNRMKARRFYPKKKHNSRFVPFAPRNTTSFIIRSKKAGGVASLVSPCPVTPAILPTPMFSPAREVVVDMAKEEWGVDGYGSMKGLIRLRSPGHEAGEEGGSSSGSDVEEHVEVERRLDHDLSRFEMIYRSSVDEQNSVMENRLDDQEMHIVRLEEENLSVKERLFLMERELEDLRRRVRFLEADNLEEESGNASDNDVGGGGEVSSERIEVSSL